MPATPKPLIDVRPDHWAIVRDILQKHVPQYEVWAFGSRAKWSAKEYSDLDLAVITDHPLSISISAALADDFAESDLPWKVDVVDWASTAESFRKIIARDKVVVQKGAGMIDALFAIPSNWEPTTLGEVCKRGGGDVQTGPFGSQLHAADYVSSGIPSIMPQNIGENRISEDGIARITDEDAQRLSRYLVRAGDIVYSRRGDVERRALIREREEGWLCGTGCLRVRFGKGVVHPPYAAHYLGHPLVREWIVRHAHGATMPNLNTSILSALPFVLPPLDEQRTIAHILGTLDDKIELNRRMNETLEAIARAMFKSWFVDFDPVRAKMSGEPPESICQRLGLTPDLLALFPDRLVVSELGEIPEGWEVKKVEVATSKIFSGGTPDTRKTDYWGGELNWCSSGETRNRFIVETEKKITQFGVDNSSTKAVVPGDILIASAGQGHTRGQTSYCAIDTFINQSVVSVRANTEKASPLWLFYNLASRYEEMRGLSDSHSSRGSLTTKLLGGMNLILPPFNLVKAFDDITGPLAHKQIEGAQQSVTLSMIRDALLPKLLSGELRVPQTETTMEALA